MIRILNVLFEERVGGPQLRALQVAEALRERGYETTVGLPKGDPQFAQLLAKHSIPFIELDLMRLRRTFDPRLHARFAARFWSNVTELRRLICQQRIEIVHTNGLMNLQAAVAARLERAGLVWHLNDVGTPKPLRLLLLPLVRHWADRIPVASRAVADYCFAGAQKVEPKLQLLYAPVDTKKFHPGGDVTATRQELGIPPDCPVIGMVANLCPGKGQEYFLEAAQVIRSRYPRAKFLVVGAPLKNRLAFWHALQEQTIRMQLQRDVIFTGRRSDVPQLLRTMTVCVQASEAEACPMAALEAGASGVPVVATNVGGTREIVEDGITGMLIEPRNPERIAWAVLHLLDSPEAARQMGLAAVRRMRERFSLETCVATHARMYDLVLRRGTRGIPVRGDDAEAEVDSIEDVYSRN